MDSKKDKLEEFVSQNREGFDSDGPSKDLWTNISSQIVSKKKIRTVPLYQALSLAAVLLVSVGLSMFYFTMQWSEKKHESEALVNPIDSEYSGISLTDVSPELAEAEDYYNKEVSHKLSQLKEIKADQEAIEEVEFLDAEFKLLKQELGESNNEKVITAMIENYQLKLDILENILEQYKKVEEDEEENETYI